MSDEIGAADADGVSVVHLPVKDEIMDNVNATSDATDIKASDINVEVVKGSDVDLSGNTDKVSFETDSFSAYALVYSEYGIVSWTGTERMSARDIADALGDNTSFGAVAGTFESAGNTDVESNIAVGTLKSVIELHTFSLTDTLLPRIPPRTEPLSLAFIHSHIPIPTEIPARSVISISKLRMVPVQSISYSCLIRILFRVTQDFTFMRLIQRAM